MRVEASIDSPLIFCNDDIRAKIKFSTQDPVHILSAVCFVQSTLHLGDLLHPEPFEVLRSRGLIVGNTSQQPQGWWGMLGLSEKPKDYKLWNSDQQLLCADTKVYEESTFEGQFSLPKDLPPSHTSKALAVQHELIIEFQILKNGQPTPCLLTLPFRLYPRSFDKYNLLGNINPPVAQTSTRQRILDHLDTLLDHRKESSVQPENPLNPDELSTKVKFHLIKEKETLATINLARPFIHTGDTLVGSISLSNECFQMCATLEMIETLEPSIAAANVEYRRVIASQSYTVFGLKTASFQLSTPAALPAQANLEQLKIEYVLRIELVCTTEPAFDPDAKAQLGTVMVSTTIPIQLVAPVKGANHPSRVWGFS